MSHLTCLLKIHWRNRLDKGNLVRTSGIDISQTDDIARPTSLNLLAMPLEDDDQLRVDRAMEEVGTDDTGTRLLVLSASKTQKLGFWAVFCTVLNRAIGSGVFVTPAILLKATGSPGASLLLWTLGAVTSICSLLVWLEFGLSIPKFELPNRNMDDSLAEGESLQSVPRSGGEKNYLEYVYGSSHFRKLRTTCCYGVVYITLGNLSGNCIAFGIYILEAAGLTGNHDSLIRGLAVICMTAACLLHITSRQGGVYTIVILAVFKACILVAIIVIGFSAMAGKSFGYGAVRGETIVDSLTQSGPSNLGIHTSFAHAKTDFASYANSILFVVFTFSGNEQPFYVRQHCRNDDGYVLAKVRCRSWARSSVQRKYLPKQPSPRRFWS